MHSTEIEETIRVRAAANKWISDNFPEQRKYITHVSPEYSKSEQAWLVGLATRELDGKPSMLGTLFIDHQWSVVKAQSPKEISAQLARLMEKQITIETVSSEKLEGENYQFILGDGIEAAASMEDRSVDLLMTDPPYGISNPYTCEKQVPRRLRKDGRDFIMPKGHFGDWDYEFEPAGWTSIVLPKIKGWAVIFCAQAQIGEYLDILKEQGFTATGTLVWQKTNPVPFNHKFKPINAWEALVVGKRQGTKFNGSVVHNVFKYKSPSPHQRIHPTQKPIPLIEKFLEIFSSEKNMVFDPFAGSGTTVIASVTMKRNVIAYEKDMNFYNLACSRIQNELRNDELF